MDSTRLKQLLLDAFPGSRLRKERRARPGGTTHTHVFLILPDGSSPEPIDGGARGAYTDHAPTYAGALENLARTHNLLPKV